MDQIISYSEQNPFVIQGFCFQAVNRILADEREAARELQEARQMQVSLLPENIPELLSSKFFD